MSGARTPTTPPTTEEEVRRETLRRLTPEKRAALLARLQAAAKPAAAAIPRLAERREAPLSFAQERLWFLEQLTPGLPVYNIALAVRLRGGLDRGALAGALAAVLRRHEVLRSRFRDRDGRPVQVMAPPAAVASPAPLLPLVDLRGGGAGSAREREARRLAVAEAEQPFDLRRGPLLRARLLRLEDAEHLLLLTLHHIASDAWSLGVLLADLVAAYSGAALAEPPVQYADYAVWQRGWLQGEMLERQVAYWRSQLAGVPVLQLPADRRRPAQPSPRGGEVPLALPAELAAALQRVSRDASATLFMTLLAGFQVLLARCSGQDDVAVGTAVSNRGREELEGLIGFFVNVLVLRTDLGGGPTFRQLLARVREVTLGAYAHQDLPFERLVEELRPVRDAGVAPLAQVAFQLQNAPTPDLRLPGLELAVVPFESRTAKYDLSVNLAEQAGGVYGMAGGIVGSVEYSADLFEPATAARLAGHLRQLLAAAAESPDEPIADLPLLDERERRQLLVDWNRTAADWGPERAVHELFAAQAAARPDAIALVGTAAGAHALSYAEMNRQADRLADRLRALGVGPEVRVAICLERGVELVVAIFAVLKSGGAYVPLDPDYPADRLAWMVADAAPKVVIAGPGASRHPGLAAGLPLIALDEAGLAGEPPAASPPPVAGLESAAYVIYTSGSTGRPKGVVVPHRGLFHSVQEDGARWVHRRPRRVLQFYSASFDASVSELFHALGWGGALVLGAAGRPLAGGELTRLLAEQAIELASFPPAVLALLDPGDLPALQTVIVAGEACPSEVVLRWVRGSPGRALWNAYGPTECTIGATTARCTPEKLPPPIGVPIKNTRCYVLDAEMAPVPVGVPGELWIGGAGVARGYLDRPEATAERFVPDLFGPPGARLYRSGDRVRWRSDGEIDFLGRVDHQVKLRGFRIEPGEIEAALRQLPGVQDALVLVREDAPGDRRLVAYVTGRQRAALPEAPAQPPADPEAQEARRELELWPSVAEYFVYDEGLYFALTHDLPRNERYRAALAAAAGATVLDVGTGADLILARLCLEAGARKVYAVEKLAATFARAVACARRLGLGERCVVLHGDAMEIELPEPVDLCVSEIVGPIGGCEGAAPILDAARRLLKPGGAMIPERSITRIAAVTLPDAFLAAPRFAGSAAPYVEQIFAEVGRPFDLRLCIKGLTAASLISDRGIFEDLDFTRPAAAAWRRDVELRIERAARLDGLILWLNLVLSAAEEIDVLEREYTWLPVYLPLFAAGVEVEPGDRILATCSGAPSDNGINPDYRASGVLLRRAGPPLPFDVDLPHHPGPAGAAAAGPGATPFYQRLWAHHSERAPARPEPPISGRQLRDDLARRLPGYMVPSAIVVLPRWPLLPNGKLDRGALPPPAAALGEPDAARFAAPQSPLEEILAGIWAEVLHVERVGAEDDFFTDLGGHSLLATQVVSRLRDRAGIELPLRSLFEAPTVRRWAALAAEAIAGAPPAAAEAIAPRALAALPLSPAPLSSAQERLWLEERLAPGLPTYNMPLAVRLTGTLDAAALDGALRALVARHEALRTRFDDAAGEPLQVIALPGASAAWMPPLAVVDLGGLAAGSGRDGREAAARRLAEEEAARPFDLRRGPLLRARLVRLDRRQHLLLLTLHHLVGDGWSLGVLAGELGALYAGEPLAEPMIQYADYAIWQRDRLRGEALERLLAHWRRQLAGVPALQLPADRRRSAAPRHRGGRVAIELSAATTAALRRRGRAAGATLFMTLLAGFQALLARYGGEDDVAVGTVVANRPRRELEGAIGCFVNTLVLRTSLAGEPSFAELLGRVRQVTLDAYAHQELPFERLVEELRPARDGAQPPLVQALLVLQNTPLESLRLRGLAAAGLEVENGTAKFDLSVLLAEVTGGGGINGIIEYDADLFAAATVERLAGHLRRLLEAAAAAPERRVGELPMLAAAERRQLLAWSGTAAERQTERAPERPVHELFEAQVERAPDAAAVLFGDLFLSYGELDRRANRLAHHLRSRGVGPEARVGLCLERGAALVAAVLGVLKAGGVYVPLDPAYPPERLAFMVEDAAPKAVLAAPRDTALAARIAGGAPVVALDADLLAAGPAANAASAVTPASGAYVIFTSGSTGRPKGTLVEHRSLFHLLQAIADRWDLRRPRRVLQFSSPSFDASVGELWAALPWGGALVPGTRSQLLPAPELARLVAEQAVDTAILPPSLLALLAPEDFPGLATLVAAGEALPADVARRWSPGRRLWNGYGPTECTVFSTIADCAELAPPPIGRPIGGARAYVLERGLEPSPIGVPGELYIGGAGLARGYLHRAALTAERFVPDLFATAAAHAEYAGGGPPGGRLYRTGDRVRWRPDGEIEYLGRLDHQVKLRGFRIELGEIESVLGDSPSVREAVVMLRQDTAGEPRLAAYVIPAGALGSGAAEPTAAALRVHCAERLPDYMVPAAFVVLARLPLTPNGKLDRRALPAPDAEHPERAAAFAAPRTPLEEILAGAWAEILGVERVGVDDDFFADLGGHSLLATRVVSRVRQLLGLELPLRSLFDAPTVGAWAAVAEEMAAIEDGSDAAAADAPRRRETGAAACGLPLSFAQERLWFLEQLTPGLAVYNVPLALRLSGRLDAAALGGALAALVARHEVLRTRFDDAAGRPLQVIEAAVAVPLPRIDLRGIACGEREVARLAAEEAARPFDLRRGPLVRALLLLTGGDEHVLLLAFHHIVSDGWSLGIVLRELGALYVGEQLTELPLQYADFALWQRRQLSDKLGGDGLGGQLAYWRRQLAGLAPLPLPADRPRPAVRSHRGGWVAVELAEDLAASLRRLGRAAGSTLFMTLLAGFQVVLGRYAGQDDVAVGTAVANRRHRDLEGLIGFFVNTLVLRADLGGGGSFRQLLARVREATLGAFAHQDLPFERLVEELRPERDTGQNPLVQVMLLLQNTPLVSLELPGLALSSLAVESRTAKLDLTLSLTERSGGGIVGNLEHDTDLFDAATAARLGGHLRRLLAAAVAAPDVAIAELPLLDEAERRQLLVDWNRTEVEWGADRLVHELFTAQAARTPAATAVIDDESADGDTSNPSGASLTYAELERRSARLAARLRRLGVGAESLVGVCLERSAGMVVALLAVLRAGGAYVPLDPDLPPARLRAMSDDADLAAVVADGRSRHLVANLGRPVLALDAEGEADGEVDCGGDGARRSPELNAANAVYAIYTSGSTGQPKGAVNTHRGVVNRLLWMQAEHRLSSADRVLQKTPFSFDVSVWEFFWPLAVGAAIVVARPGGHRDADYLAAVIARRRVTVLHFVPSMLAAFLDAGGMARCPVLRQVFASGEALPDALRRRFFAQSAAALSNLYGPTEAAVDVTAWRCAPGGAPRSLPIGRPIANTRIYVLDGALEPSPAGVPGELYIAGVGLARGYLARPGLTAERFVPDPFASLRGLAGERMYRTGDLARWRADGELEYLGRLDQQVKLRGFRVEPGEIEAVLRAAPEVGETVVQLREEAPGDRRLVAYVVPAGAIEATAEAAVELDRAGLRRLCMERLPAYMVPAAFVPLPRLPLLPNGKLDRRALPAPDAAASPAAAARSAPPEGPLEEIVAAIWAEVLGVERVGAEEGFFTDLGGHSLLATQVVSRVRERLGIELPLRSLFEAPTVRAWARRAAGGASALADPLADRILPAPRTAELPLSYAQERLWFLEQLMPGLAVYNLPLAVRLTGRLDRAALGRALAAVVARHEVLRTGFRTVEGRPAQAIAAADETAVPLSLVDLRGLGAAGQPAAAIAPLAERLATDEAGELFDLARGPLLRARLVQVADDEHLLLLTIHHIASDGWSLGVLVGELGTLYAGGAPPALPIQYADYAVWQRRWLAGEVLARQLDYWRRQLAGLPVLELPTDRPRPAVSRHRGGQVRLAIPPALAAELKKLGRASGATLFMTLLAGFQALLARISGQGDFAVGTAVANRRRRELEGLIGFFVNTLALRADLAGDPTFGELLARGREAALAAYEHQDLPFEKLVEELRPARDTGREPLVQVTFMLQNAPLPELRLPGLDLVGLPVENRTAKFDLLVSMTEGAGGIGATWEHDSDLFDAATVERMAGHHLRLLAAAVEDPSRRVAALPLLDAAERRQLLVDWSRAAPAEHDAEPSESGAELLVHERFAAQAVRTPEAVAVAAGARHLTYAGLARRVDRLARRLRAEGVGPEVRVGLCLDRGPDLVVAVLAALAAGGAYVPLDPAYPAERLAFMIADAAPRAVLTTAAHRHLVAAAPVLCLDDEEGLGAPDVAVDGAEAPPLAPPSDLLDRSAYVIFTSGSTGRPKGVAMPHRALAGLIAWQLRDTPRPARTLQLAPASFDVSFQELATTLGGGGALVLVDEDVRRDPRALARLLVAEGVERLFLPFTALQHLAQAWAALEAPYRPADGALAEVITAGERLQASVEVAALFRALPGASLWNQYGPTESHVVTSARLPAAVDAWDVYPAIGRPIAAARIVVLDAEMEPAPVGVPGELYIGGVPLARGYLHRPALTAERFVPAPAGDAGGRLYRSGDRARWRPDGTLEHLGRLDQQVKLRGFRIEPGEIEALLAASPGVREAAVAVREDTPGDQRLVAYVVLQPAADSDASADHAAEATAPAPSLPELRRRCQEALPAFMVPSAFVVLAALPLLPSGKLDRRALPAAEGGRAQVAARFVAPESAVEREVAEIWRQVLQVDRVGIHDNFFDLGGHSLLAVRLHGRLQAMAAERLPAGREISVIDVFRHPTVESFARFLARAAAVEGAPAPLSAAKSERLVDGRAKLGQQAARRQAATTKRRAP